MSGRPLEVSHFPHALPNGLQLLRNSQNNKNFCTSIMQLNNVTIQSSSEKRIVMKFKDLFIEDLLVAVQIVSFLI